MQPRRSTWKRIVRGLAALSLLATCALGGCSDHPAAKSDPLTTELDPPAAKNDQPKPLPKEIVEAWKAAGAVVGWMQLDDFGRSQWLPEGNGVAGALPVFSFPSWPEGQLAKLPVPAAPFGLYLESPKGLTDAGLKELTGLKDLQELTLLSREVTDAGLKELAALKSLQTDRKSVV